MSIIYHNILAFYRRLVNKIFTLFGKTIYFENKYGIKAYSKPQIVEEEIKNTKIISINPSDVFLSFDALSDEYTHVDKSITDSPHVELIKAIRDGNNIKKTHYYIEEVCGCLDGRFELADRKSLIHQHIYAFHMRKNDKKPLVYKLNNKYYVLDGKHRLSSALLKKEKKVCCIEVPICFIATHSYTEGIYNKMIESGERYKKNINHIQMIFDAAKL